MASKSNKGKASENQDHNSGAALGDEADAERNFAADVLGDDSPEGFRRVNPLDGARLYFKAVEGATVRGILLGRFKRLDGDDGDDDKFYYQIRLTRPCESLTDAEGNPITGDVGVIVHLDERSGLRDLEPLASLKKPQEVVVRSVEKVKLKRSAGTFWRWDVFGREAPTGLLAKLAEIVKNTDETPF